MNKGRREDLKLAIDLIDRVITIINKCKNDEEDAMCNLEGTSLEYTERYEKMESSCDYIDSALDSLESAKDDIQLAMYP